jgi:glycogen(starch) synthase
MSTGRRVAVVTPWYPDTQRPYRGSFVQAMVTAVEPDCDAVDVYHLDAWSVGPKSGERDERLWDFHAGLVRRSCPPLAAPGKAVLYRIPALMPRTTDWIRHSDEYARWLGAFLGGRSLEAPIVHAHVPLQGGWAALRHAGPDAKVYTTEHSSFLASVLEQPAARDRYDEILDRVAGFFVVGEPLHDLIGSVFPHHAGKVRYIANPIDFAVRRERPPTILRRWLSVAGMIERKRIDYLLEAFAACRADDPDLTLTLAGEGELLGAMVRRAEELGLAGAVDFLGAVDPSRIPALMAEHDLFVHTSRHETFGVVVVEALAAGTPVLVSRSGGSDQVLEGVEDDAGMLFDVEDDPAVLVGAYRALRERHPHKTDLDRAREAMRAKYSYETVARRHYEIWGTA